MCRSGLPMTELDNDDIDDDVDKVKTEGVKEKGARTMPVDDNGEDEETGVIASDADAKEEDELD